MIPDEYGNDDDDDDNGYLFNLRGKFLMMLMTFFFENWDWMDQWINHN